MPKFQNMKNELKNLNIAIFKSTYKDVVEDMVQEEQWT